MRARAGFVLTGGRSSRMGRDKALLPQGAATLVERIAAEVRAAAGSVTLVGAPERYGGLAFPVLADLRPGEGPLAGIETALAHTEAVWNLIVACDMPAITAGVLRLLLDATEGSGADAVITETPDGRLHPLCAVYHRRCRERFAALLEAGNRRMMEALGPLQILRKPLDPKYLLNWNRPEDVASAHDRDLSPLHRVPPRS